MASTGINAVEAMSESERNFRSILCVDGWTVARQVVRALADSYERVFGTPLPGSAA